MEYEKLIPVADYIPHRPPMSMVDYIVETEDGKNLVLATIRPDNRFLNSEGILDRSVIPELVAQAAAATNSLRNNGMCRPGMLALAREVVFHNDIHANDELVISANDESPMPGWFVLDFKIECSNRKELCASGEISVCLLG